MVRLGIARRPVHHPPGFFQFAAGLTQIVLQKDLTPSPAGPPRLSSGGDPGAVLPLALWKAARQFRQSLRGRFAGQDVTPDPFDLRGHLMVPSLERMPVDLEEERHSQFVAHSGTKSSVVPVSAIPQDRRPRYPIAPRLAKQSQPQLRLGGEGHFLRDPGLGAPLPVLGPTLGQIPAPPTGAATHPSLTTTSTLTWQLACLPTAPQY